MSGFVFFREKQLALRIAAAWPFHKTVAGSVRAVLDEEIRRSGSLDEVQLYFENPCAQACEFCEEPRRRDRFPSRHLTSLLLRSQELGLDLVGSGALAALVDALGDLEPKAPLTITGHDWTRHPRHPEILVALERRPDARLRLQGPSLGFSSPELTRRVAALPGLEWIATTLQSSDAAEHDAMVGAPGAHAELLAALDNLKAARVPLVLTVVLSRRALRTLPETLSFLSARGLSVSLQAFIPDEAMGPAFDVLAPLDELRRALDRAPREALGAIHSVVGVPLCAAPAPLRRKIAPAHRMKGREGARFGAGCGTCAARGRCSGVPSSYLVALGARGMEPLASTD